MLREKIIWTGDCFSKRLFPAIILMHRLTGILLTLPFFLSYLSERTSEGVYLLDGNILAIVKPMFIIWMSIVEE